MRRFLAAGQAAADIAHQGIDGHRHGSDFRMHGRQVRAGLPLLVIRRGGKEADVVGNRAGKQGVFLHDRAQQLPVVRQAQAAQLDAADVDFSFRRLQQAQEHLPLRRCRPRSILA